MRQAPLDTDLFIDRLSAVRLPNVFNPYAEISPASDRNDAAEIRKNNLRSIIDAAIGSGVDSMWIARDLGYRGGRRTGLALTDDAHIDAHAALLGATGLRRPTVGPAVVERTASVVWDTLGTINRRIFLWNVFPLHPHEAGDPDSNRLHTKAEREVARPFLLWLLERLRPTSIVAIGRDAQNALADMGVDDDVTQVRHPSYGGQKEFVEGVLSLHGVVGRSPTMPDLFS